MMQDANVEQAKELRTIEIGQASADETTKASAAESEKPVVDQSNFGPDMSGSEDEASEVWHITMLLLLVNNHAVLFML